MTIDQARNSIGRRVAYRERYSTTVEHGEIKHVSDTFVFVRYDSGRLKGAAPSMLSLVGAP